MFLFILGVTIGAFLMVLPDIVTAITSWVQGRRQARLAQAVTAELTRRAQADEWAQWNAHESYMMNGTTSGPGPFVPIQHP